MNPLRLLTGALAAAAGTFVLIPASSPRFWIVELAVTEWGHVVVLGAVAAIILPWWASWTGRFGVSFWILAAALALRPMLEARQVADGLPTELAARGLDTPPVSGPDARARPAPYVLTNLVLGVRSPETAPHELPFAEIDSHTLRLYLYSPAGGGPAPGVIVLHPGQWSRGGPRELEPLSHYLAARGFLVAAVEYRLTPLWRFPAQRDDVLAAIEYLKKAAPSIGLDPRRLALVGREAGGQLALTTAYTSGDPAIRGVVSFYAPTDLRLYHDSPGPLADNARLAVEQYLGSTPQTTPRAYDAASPARLAGRQSVPTLIIHGVRDEMVPVEQSLLLDERLSAAQVPHHTLLLPWATHKCDLNFSGPCGQISTYAIERFLAAIMER